MLRSQLTTLDLGNLLVDDMTPLNIPKDYSQPDRDTLLLGVCTENIQLLVNDIWKLPTHRADDVQVVDLPEGKALLPREKAPPKPAPETRWQAFAKLKGIANRKKTRKVWDEDSKSWVPRFGLGSKRQQEAKQWLLEVPQSLDPNTDMFAKLKEEKKERKAKNELNRLRNIARNVKGKAASGVLPGSVSNASEGSTALAKALSVAQTSDASLGQFSKKLKDENKKKFSKGGQRRKFESSAAFSASDERKRATVVLQELQRKRPKVDASKAARKLQVASEARRRKEKAEGAGKKKKLLTDMVSKRKIKQKAGAKKFKNKVSRTGKKKK